MSRFLVLNFQDFGLNHNITKTIQSHTPFCICCLDTTAPLLNLTTCKHGKYLDIFTKPQGMFKDLVCSHCHTVLKRIEDFRQQVEDSFKIIQDETFNISKTESIKTNNLEIKKVVNIYLPPVKPAPIMNRNEPKIPVNEEETQEKEAKIPKIEETCVKNDRVLSKIEFNNLDSRQSLSEDQNTKDKEAQMIKSKSKTIEKDSEATIEIKIEPPEVCKQIDNEIRTIERDSSPPQQRKNRYNVRMVTLTKEELLHERLALAQSRQYLAHVHRCEHCLVGFNYLANIKDHMKRKHSPKVGSATCEICLQVIYPPGGINAHNFRHYTRYECESCGDKYAEYNDALNHFKVAHQKAERAYRCRHCDFVTPNFKQLAIHRLRHERVACKDCGLVLNSSAALRQHMISSHKKYQYQCQLCSTVYESKKAYVCHMRSHGEHARCAACNFTFKSWHAYSAHLALSTAHAPRRDKYKCEECGMAFGAVGSLRAHARARHARARVLQCPRSHCSKVFTLSVELKQHVDKMHNEIRKCRVIVCDHCGKAYKSRVHLIRHMEESHKQKKSKKVLKKKQRSS